MGAEFTCQPDFDVAATPPPMVELRRWVRAVLGDRYTEAVGDVELAVTELVTNAYEHAGGVVAVRLSRLSGMRVARLEVDDARPNLPLTTGSSTAGACRGRGLRLVEAVAEAWGVVRAANRKTVWVNVALLR